MNSVLSPFNCSLLLHIHCRRHSSASRDRQQPAVQLRIVSVQVTVEMMFGGQRDKVQTTQAQAADVVARRHCCRYENIQSSAAPQTPNESRRRRSRQVKEGQCCYGRVQSVCPTAALLPQRSSSHGIFGKRTARRAASHYHLESQVIDCAGLLARAA